MVKVGRAVETSVKTVKSPTNHPQVVLLLLLQVHAGAARALGHYRTVPAHTIATVARWGRGSVAVACGKI